MHQCNNLAKSCIPQCSSEGCTHSNAFISVRRHAQPAWLASLVHATCGVYMFQACQSHADADPCQSLKQMMHHALQTDAVLQCNSRGGLPEQRIRDSFADVVVQVWQGCQRVLWEQPNGGSHWPRVARYVGLRAHAVSPDRLEVYSLVGVLLMVPVCLLR